MLKTITMIIYTILIMNFFFLSISNTSNLFSFHSIWFIKTLIIWYFNYIITESLYVINVANNSSRFTKTKKKKKHLAKIILINLTYFLYDRKLLGKLINKMEIALFFTLIDFKPIIQNKEIAKTHQIGSI